MGVVGHPFGMGPAELVIILLVLVLLFGATRLKDLGGSLGQGIKEFRSAVKSDEPDADTSTKSSQAQEEPAEAQANGSEVIPAVKCSSCNALNPQEAKFCSSCGTALAAPVA